MTVLVFPPCGPIWFLMVPLWMSIFKILNEISIARAFCITRSPEIAQISTTRCFSFPLGEYGGHDDFSFCVFKCGTGKIIMSKSKMCMHQYIEYLKRVNAR